MTSRSAAGRMIDRPTIDRRTFVAALAACASVPTLLAACDDRAADVPNAGSDAFPYRDATIASLTQAMERGEVTSEALVTAYFARMDAIDTRGATLRAIIERNPDALAIARERDTERASGRRRGVLHGVPVILKDNIDTGDRMLTTAGSLALAGAPAPRDAFLVEQLRAAGAVILAKANLSEWANFRSTTSTSGWSSRGGQTKNPHVLDRNPCGSSSGTGAAIAASLGAVGIGTETDGSIICPSSSNGIVGVKPTVGLVSRSGIVPISATQDTAGPMTRTVEDAAIVLSVIAGTDARDPSTAEADTRRVDFRAALDANALRGARVGVARNLAGFDARVDGQLDVAIDVLKRAGADLVDPCDVPTAGSYDAAEMEVLLYEFKAGVNAYLASRGGTVAVHTLAEVIAWNRAHASEAMPHFAQELLERAEAKGPLTETAYLEALAACRQRARTEGLDRVFATQRVEALIAPSNGPVWATDYAKGDVYGGGNSSVAAVAGYPSVTVPTGFASALPLGLSFIGPAYSEARLLSLAYAYEQLTRARRAPTYRPTDALSNARPTPAHVPTAGDSAR